MNFLIHVLLISTSAFAGFDQVCEDLYRLTCAPGTYDDGTGTANLEKGSAQDFTKVGESAKAQLNKFLLDPEKVYFRKQILSATGLSLNPECEDGEDSPTPACVDLMNQGAMTYLGKSLGAQNTMVQGSLYSDPNVAEISALVNTPEFNGIKKQLLKEFKNQLEIEQFDKSLSTDIYPRVKSILIKKIEASVPDARTRKNMIDKVKSITFAGSDCSQGTESLSSILTTNAFYNPSANEFRYCSGLGLNNKSAFNIAFVIAHELAHSIDPCGITVGPRDFTFKYRDGSTQDAAENQFPVPGVLKCLRSPESVQAIRNQQTAGSGGYGMPYPGPTYPTYPIDYPNSGYPRTRVRAQRTPQQNYQMPNSQGYKAEPVFTGFCQDDQIGESFSDWMAAEVTPEFIAEKYPNLTQKQLRFGYANVGKNLCGSDGGSGQFDVHPSWQRRIDYVLLMQPKVRQQMGCAARVNARKYCKVRDKLAHETKDDDAVMPDPALTDEEPAMLPPKATK